MEYKTTIQLPQTDFPMRANLPQREPAILQRWMDDDLFGQLRQVSSGRPKFILHDGPPYANGHIHIGHAINKVLKDVIVKTQQMRGFDAHYVPGWDCHGLPIETRVEQELKQAGADKQAVSTVEFRQRCRRFAHQWVDIQRSEFQRLGIMGDWNNPYLTMDYRFEADTVRELGKFLLNGALYKGFKPVYWCIHDVTALAEAEVEYQDHTSTAVYVKFPLAADETLQDVAPELANKPVAVVIWTTTPWTLPANLGVCLNPHFDYVALRLVNGAHHVCWQPDEILLMAEGLMNTALSALQLTPDQVEVVAHMAGAALDRKRFRHPWLDQDAPILLGEHVTLEAGTGCVHTAPGHGQDDYVVGSRYGLAVFNPVDDQGRFRPETPLFGGLTVHEANPQVVELLQQRGALLARHALRHSYPHCWRCHQPVITRATPQWFIAMDATGLRQKALTAIQATQWIPSWGMDRIYNMVANRPDWCVSRQRSWGVPIAVLVCQQCQSHVADDTVTEAIAQQVEQHGADVWFQRQAADFLPPDYRCCQCGGQQFRQEQDILDVWFDSGVTHAAVLERRQELAWPADLYLEGSDQHRGWFHSSLLTSVGTRGTAPYRSVLTHGFVVDGKGRKMSKSLGNVVAPDKIIQQYGADILRMWVTAEDYAGDIRISTEILDGLADAYRRIRNTLRFLLGNLAGFDADRQQLPYSQLLSLDRWALHRLHQLITRVQQAYSDYAFHRVYQELHYFCSMDMGAFYLDILKDRLYCDGKESLPRRSAQTVLHHTLESLVRLMAPILSFTAEEVWSYMSGSRCSSVHLANMPHAPDEWHDTVLEQDWEQLRRIRSEVYRWLEQDRQEKRIGSFMEASVTLYVAEPLQQLLAGFDDLARLFIVATVTVLPLEQAPPQALVAQEMAADLKLVTAVAGGYKCLRCWNWSEQTGSGDDVHLCPRCAAVIAALS
ncbi:MAG: isoleucine--tRNA ligase [Magnetococcales bacterium]|nr:isoleucine--tRNA ligase [Magnetococcales bacterium]